MSRLGDTGRAAGNWLSIAALVSLTGMLFGVVAPPADEPPGASAQVVALFRLLVVVVTTVTLVFGPGLIMRRILPVDMNMPLGFVPIPGILILAVSGGLIWAIDGMSPAVTARLLMAALLVGIMVGAAFERGRNDWLQEAERPVVGLSAVVFLIALGRSLWSAGPDGELFGRSISRILEVGDRSDSRISFYLVQMIANHLDPYTGAGAMLYAPWAFSDRGPLPGLITAPIVLITGASPSVASTDQPWPENPWSPFDAQGFMAYRIVMMVLALTALLAVYTLTKYVAGAKTACFATVVVAGTPFFIHDVYFTWPKFLAAAQVLLAAYLILRRKPLYAGLFVGLGFLIHPLALFSVPALLLLAVLTSTGTWKHRAMAVTVGICGFLVSLGAVWYAWKGANGGAYTQDRFFSYFTMANNGPADSFGMWFGERADSVANTLIPFRLLIFESDNPSINVFGGHSSDIIHFTFQYWNGLPFGVGILFFPFLVMGLFRLFRLHPLLMTSIVIVPFVGFAIYWGSFSSGLLREGLHAWVLTVLILWALEVRPLLAAGGIGAQVVRVVLVARLVDVLVMLFLPTLIAPDPDRPQFRLTDAAGIAMMIVGVIALGWLTVRLSAPDPLMDPQEPTTAPVGFWAGLSPHPNPALRLSATQEASRVPVGGVEGGDAARRPV